MPLLTIDTQIAQGNDNAAGLTLVTSLSASSISFLEPLTIFKPSRGQVRIKADGTSGYAGYRSLQWKSGLLWLAQFEYLRANYEGPVTIKSTFEGVTWANYNAVLTLGNIEEYELVNETQYGWAIVDFIWRFTRVEAL